MSAVSADIAIHGGRRPKGGRRSTGRSGLRRVERTERPVARLITFSASLRFPKPRLLRAALPPRH